MASVRWRTRLNALFDKLGREEEFGTTANNNNAKHLLNDSKNIVEVKDGCLYLWTSNERNIVAVDLDKQEKQQDEIQRFVPTCPPIYEIQSLVLDPTVQRVALIGANGVNVVELPCRSQRRPPSSTTAASAHRLLCSSVEIAERFFLCNPNCRVMQAKWHPDSDTSTHLVILFSNNYLRVYDCRLPVTPVHVYQMGQVPVFRLSPSTVSSFGSALGETAVDFDFGRPVPAVDKFNRKVINRIVDDQTLVWPVFILRGNGDVYSMWLTDPKYSVKCEVKGPLTMHPPAEDNYGVDACSILVLPSVPPVVVIATCSGMLYHCIALDNDEQNDNEDRMSEVSWSASKSSQTLGAPDVSLYVYESVELEMVLGSNEEAVLDDVTCPIHLHKDPTTTVRYHCSHAAGVHTVALPIIPQLESLTDNASGDVADTLSTIENQNCIVEHLICTRPLSNSPASPILGVGIAYGQSLGGTTLLCLIAPYDLLSVPLVPTYLDKLPHLLMEAEDEVSAEFRSATREPFDQHIRMLLQRKTSNPIFKASTTANPTPQDCFQLLNRSTRILREEYIQRLDLAREKIEERMKVLQDLKVQQLAELKVMEKMREVMAIKAEDLAEKYENLRDAQESIGKRVEWVLRALLRQTPMLSDAESSMHRELKSLNEKMKHMKNSIEQVKVKHNYQKSVAEQYEASIAQQRPIGKPSDAQLKLIKEFLMEESQKLSLLIEKMKEIQSKLGL